MGAAGSGMLNPTFVLIVIVVVALMAVLIVVGVRREREHRQRIRQLAAYHGWTVTERPVVEWTTRLPGRNKRGVSTLMSGMAYGWPASVAEYSYSTTSTDSNGGTTTQHHHFIVAAVQLDEPYPPVAVELRGAMSRFGRTLFGANAAATGDDEFDREFRVKTRDPALARTLIGPALIDDHLAGRVPEWSIAGHYLLTWQPGRIGRTDPIAELAVPLVRVAQLLGR
jgi:hypothetical protein